MCTKDIVPGTGLNPDGAMWFPFRLGRDVTTRFVGLADPVERTRAAPVYYRNAHFSKERVAMADFITCPKCGATIPLTDVITHQIEEQLQVRLTQALQEREQQYSEALAVKEVELRQEFNTAQAEHEGELVKRAEKKVATDIADFETRLAEQDEELSTARTLELELRRAQRKLDEDREALDLVVARRIDKERKKVAEDATRLLTEDH